MGEGIPKVKKWVLSKHAAERAEERDISLEDIDLLVKSPDTVIPQGPKFIFVKNFTRRNDNDLAAVLLEMQSEDVWVVITIMTNFEAKG